MKSTKSKESRLKSFSEKPKKALWTLAIPILAGMSIQTIYTIVDMIFIGRLGGEAIAAVAFNMPLLFFVLGLSMGFGSGVTASIARFIGASDKTNADNSAEHALLMASVISIVMVIVGLLYGKRLLAILGTPPELINMAWSYLWIITIGLFFMVFSGFFRSILAGEGDMKTPMIISATGTILNIILDPIFIFVLGFGVPGAAIATVISQATVFSIFIYFFLVKEHTYVTFRMKDFSFSRYIIYDIIKVGIPASMAMIIMSLGQAVFNKILVSYSAFSVAAYQIGGRIDIVIFLPIMAIATALTTLVGMFYGAKDIDNVKFIIKYGMLHSVLITTIGSIIIFMLAPLIVKGFTSELEIQQIAVTYLRFVVIIYPLISIGMTSGRVMQGLGMGLPMLVITTIRVLGISAPLALIFNYVYHKPIEWMWYAMIISTVTAVSTAVFWLRFALRRRIITV
ncbi:MAG: MATE family efflux transporter [Candidatus Neomarinimicrobiota bacterium]